MNLRRAARRPGRTLTRMCAVRGVCALATFRELGKVVLDLVSNSNYAVVYILNLLRHVSKMYTPPEGRRARSTVQLRCTLRTEHHYTDPLYACRIAECASPIALRPWCTVTPSTARRARSSSRHGACRVKRNGDQLKLAT